MGCRKTESAARQVPPPLSRGDTVVIERSAADFFEARVLVASDGALKVQTTDEGDPVTVARGDAYAIPSASASFARGDFAICNERATRWVACKIERAGPDSLTAVLPTGDQLVLPPLRAIAPGSMTRIDIQHLLEQRDTERRFDDLAARAGEPASPTGWTPAAHEPVLARQGGGWFSAHVARGVADGGVEVTWEGREHPQAVPLAQVVPVPPFAHAFRAGEFALLPGSTSAEAWGPVQVEAVGTDEAVVVDQQGNRRRVSVRTLVPLEPRARPRR
jgi:hypothetical protein